MEGQASTFFNCCAAVDKERKQATGWKWSHSLPANENLPSWNLCLLCEQSPWLMGLRHCGTVQARGSRSIRVYRQCHLLTADGTRARPGDTVPYAIVTVHPGGTS